MGHFEDEHRAFYREQMRRLLELVDACDDARTVAALLQATTFYLDKLTERQSTLPADG